MFDKIESKGDWDRLLRTAEEGNPEYQYEVG
jgi:hypothetical protein